MKVAILYGWCEGPRLARRLIRTLERHGHTVVKDVSSADVIIAHSLGCYLMPKDAVAHKILLVGLPNRSLHSLPFFIVHKMLTSFVYSMSHGHLLFWIRKAAWNSIYFITKTLSDTEIKSFNDTSLLPDATSTREVILVRNKHDRFIHATRARRLAEEKDWRYEVLKGAHDDLWMNPDEYVQLLEAI